MTERSIPGATPRRESATAIDFLRQHDRLAAMLPTAERLLRLREDVMALMPAPLRDRCDVASLDEEAVLLRVSSASAAAKLRQTLPRLRDGLLDRGWKVNAIRIRVQPRDTSYESMTCTLSQAHAMSAAGIAAFAQLGENLPESPLKAAVARLVGRRAVGTSR